VMFLDVKFLDYAFCFQQAFRWEGEVKKVHTWSPALVDLLTDFLPAVFPFPRPDMIARR